MHHDAAPSCRPNGLQPPAPRAAHNCSLTRLAYTAAHASRITTPPTAARDERLTSACSTRSAHHDAAHGCSRRATRIRMHHTARATRRRPQLISTSDSHPHAAHGARTTTPPSAAGDYRSASSFSTRCAQHDAAHSCSRRATRIRLQPATARTTTPATAARDERLTAACSTRGAHHDGAPNSLPLEVLRVGGYRAQDLRACQALPAHTSLGMRVGGQRARRRKTSQSQRDRRMCRLPVPEHDTPRPEEPLRDRKARSARDR